MKVYKHNATWQARADKRLVAAFKRWAAQKWKARDRRGIKQIGGIAAALNDLLYAHLSRVDCLPEGIDPREWRDPMTVVEAEQGAREKKEGA